MKRIILICLLLISCAKSNTSQVMTNDFDKDLSFQEFMTKIINYAKNSDFPNID
tara:strand:- start:297 stop:458 length:162 start_codon:yes stop_codon:yes gene_type:complete